MHFYWSLARVITVSNLDSRQRFNLILSIEPNKMKPKPSLGQGWFSRFRWCKCDNIQYLQLLTQSLDKALEAKTTAKTMKFMTFRQNSFSWPACVFMKREWSVLRSHVHPCAPNGSRKASVRLEASLCSHLYRALTSPCICIHHRFCWLVDMEQT